MEVRILLPEPAAVVMAAGSGTRMRSVLPKPLHLLAGKPLIAHILDALAAVGAKPVVVVTPGGDSLDDETAGSAPTDAIARAVGDHRTAPRFAPQPVQRGTADAAAIGLAALVGADSEPSGEAPTDVLVLAADTPLLRPSTLASVVEARRAGGCAAALLSAHVPDPTGYGRVVRHGSGAAAADQPELAGAVVGIVEEADATNEQRQITEVNASVYCFDTAKLSAALADLPASNATGEQYLTDVVARLVEAGETVTAVVADDATEITGVNTPEQLAACEEILGRRNAGG